MKLGKLTLALLLTTLAAKSYAACSIHTPGDCLKDPGSIGSGEMLGRFELSVKNTCHKPIQVAVHYKVIPDGSSSTLACVGCENPSWVTNGYWSLAPNEQKFIAVTQNKIAYIHAHSNDGQTTWGNSDKQWKVGSEYKPFFEISMGDSYKRWTQTLSCN